MFESYQGFIMMTGKERIRKALMREKTDRTPAHFNATPYVWENLQKHLGLSNNEAVLQHLQIDTRDCNLGSPNAPKYEKRYINETDYEIEGAWGGMSRAVWSGIEYNSTSIEWPLEGTEDPDDVDKKVRWPQPSWFDYSKITRDVETHGDKAIIVGHWGPFQTCTSLRREDQLYMDMAINPEFAKKLFDRMHQFQMWHYKNMFEAGKGKIDILRTHDDYGTQISTLFSIDMWRDYFAENTRELVELAHKYGAFFWQHSCGCIPTIIPELINCGIDAIEPIQPVAGMEPETLKEKFGGKVTFVGGIDTQHLLPFAKPEEVRETVRRYVKVLGSTNGYILYPSQAWESCVPVENIIATYDMSLR